MSMAKQLLAGAESDALSPAAEIIGENEDLMRQILIYIPAIPLIRFKSVSKLWFRIISNPQFRRHHTSIRSPTSFYPSGLYFYNSLPGVRQLESVTLPDSQNQPFRLPPIPNLPQVKLLQSCNGLCLLSATATENSEAKIYYLYNPTTGEIIELPLPEKSDYRSILGCNLAFDPLRSPDYNVVWVVKSRNVYEVVVYSSATLKWTTVRCYPFHGADFSKGVYCHGAINWLAYDNTLQQPVCVSFKVDALIFGIIELPLMPYSASAGFRYLGWWQGYVHVVRDPNFGEITFGVYEKDCETGKRSHKYCLNLSKLRSEFPEIVVKDGERMQDAFRILCVFKGEKEQDWGVVLRIPGKVISFNLVTETSEILYELPSKVFDTSSLDSISAYQYIATLSPLSTSLNLDV